MKASDAPATESQFLSVIRVWAAMAWADGVVTEREAVAMRRVIEGADLDSDERATALSWLESKVDLDTSKIDDLSDRARQGIYRAAVRLAAVDEVVDSELAFLDRLRRGLGLDEDASR